MMRCEVNDCHLHSHLEGLIHNQGSCSVSCDTSTELRWDSDS